jgi:hypothetical protein
MSYAKDLIERTAATYGTSFLGLLLANGFDLTDVSSLRAAAIAAVPAGLAVLYGWLAGFTGNPDTAGFTDSRNK